MSCSPFLHFKTALFKSASLFRHVILGLVFTKLLTIIICVGVLYRISNQNILSKPFVTKVPLTSIVDLRLIYHRLGHCYKPITAMEQGALKNVNNSLNTNLYSYLETSGIESSNLYLNVAHFFNTSAN